jgi:hypothetical protein
VGISIRLPEGRLPAGRRSATAEAPVEELAGFTGIVSEVFFTDLEASQHENLENTGQKYYLVPILTGKHLSNFLYKLLHILSISVKVAQSQSEQRENY